MAPSATYDELTDLNAMWVDPEAIEPEMMAQNLPEGDYIVRVDACRYERTQTFKRILKWELVVVAGELNTRTTTRVNMLESAQNIGWLKKDLRSAGVDIDAADFDIAQFIANGTSVLIGKLLKITSKKGKPNAETGRDNWNVYINAVATDADVARVNAGGSVNGAGSASATSTGGAGGDGGSTPPANQGSEAGNPWAG